MKKTTFILSLLLLLITSAAVSQGQIADPSTSTIINTKKKELVKLNMPVSVTGQDRAYRTAHTPYQSHLLAWNGQDWDSTLFLTHSYTGSRLDETVEGMLFPSGYMPLRKLNYTYDQGELIIATEKGWDGTDWYDDYRTSYYFSTQGDPAGTVEESFNGTAWDTTFGERILHSYNANGRLEEAILQEYISNIGWETQEKQEYIYDAAGIPVEVKLYAPVGTGYELEGRMTSIVWYDYSKQLHTSYIYQQWDGSSWMDAEKNVMTYNAFDDIAEILIQVYYNGAWINYLSIYATHDQKGNVTEEGFKIFNGIEWEIMEGTKHALSYDQHNRVTVDEMQYYDSFGLTWENSIKMLYIQPVILSVQAPVKAVSTKIYPNPVQDQLHISIADDMTEPATITLYDLSGRMIFRESAKEQNITIDLSDLTTGTYIVTVDSGMERSTQKITKL